MNVEKAIADLRLQLKVVNQLIITFERRKISISEDGRIFATRF
jgi:hypothetical protein